jgi:hypothetical protein
MAIDYINSSKISDSSYGSIALPVPAGTDADSWLIVCWFVANAPAGVLTPSGFTALHVGVPAGTEAMAYFAGQATSDITLALADDTTSWMSARAVAYSGAGGVDVSAFGDSAAAATNTPAVSVTTTVAGTKLVVASINDSAANPAAPSGFTRRVADSSTPMVISDKDQAAAGASGDVTQTWSAAGNNSIGLIALKPAGGDDGGGTLGPGLWAAVDGDWRAITRSAV